MSKNSEMWKFNHFYTPNMMGFLGYHSVNLQRPKTFYSTNIKLIKEGGPAQVKKSKKVLERKESKEV